MDCSIKPCLLLGMVVIIERLELRILLVEGLFLVILKVATWPTNVTFLRIVSHITERSYTFEHHLIVMRLILTIV